ncbi:MAG TPA: toll/interleukin-1 receptor domain-containing protein [Pyrinomonadaceae bacterium]|nr:toll/interleukin-1 receptor domain-containing protein [Pyrinomonadaceae bacterium]
MEEARNRGVAPSLPRFMIGADLQHLDFTSDFGVLGNEHFCGMYLGVDFRNAILRGSKFSRTDVSNANLRGADLRGTNFIGTNLYGTLFEYANLGDTDLREANMVSAELQDVTVKGARFEGARFGKTTIGAVDLSGACGLPDVVHVAPSVIGSDTLEMTAAGLAHQPDRVADEVFAFFTKAGVHRELLDVFRTWIGKPIEFYSCFISYSHADKEFARRLYDALQGRGIRCWLDEHQILPGDNIYDVVDRGIRLWDKVLLCCSEASLTSWWVDKELSTAFEKEQALQKERGAKVFAVVPLDIDVYLFHWNDGKASKLLLIPVAPSRMRVS